MKLSLYRCMVWVITAGLTASCRPAAEIQPNDLRTYTVPRSANAAPLATRPPSGTPAGAMPAAASDSLALEYDLPEGWQDKGASGMRLATLRTGPDSAADAGEITIIPASGTLEGNATRWQEQLAPGASPDRVSQAIAEAEKVPVNGTEGTILLLVDDTAAPQQAILAAMIPLESSSSLFVKFKGPAATARMLREPFTAFIRSIRWK